jgi:hypothetical protein
LNGVVNADDRAHECPRPADLRCGRQDQLFLTNYWLFLTQNMSRIVKSERDLSVRST